MRKLSHFFTFAQRTAYTLSRRPVWVSAFILLTRHRKRIVHTPVTKQPIFSVFSFFSLSPCQPSRYHPPLFRRCSLSLSFVCQISLVLAFIQSHGRSVIKIFLRLPGYFSFSLCFFLPLPYLAHFPLPPAPS